MNYLNLFLSFLKIGTFTFGGGHAMIPLIQEEMKKKNWMTMQELIDFIAISESSPGPFAINIATFVGLKVGNIFGAIISTIGVVFTSFFLILIIAKAFDRFKENKIVKGCMYGLKPTVVALIGSAVVTTAMSVFIGESNVISVVKTYEFWQSAFIFIVALIMALKKVHPIKIIVLSALMGIFIGFI